MRHNVFFRWDNLLQENNTAFPTRPQAVFVNIRELKDSANPHVLPLNQVRTSRYPYVTSPVQLTPVKVDKHKLILRLEVCALCHTLTSVKLAWSQNHRSVT
jgi:hypothetical protein